MTEPHLPNPTRCPDCGQPSDPGDRFCRQCGVNLTDNELPGEAERLRQEQIDRLRRYLPLPLADRLLTMEGPVRGERRQVTILFVDMVGSTALAETLDPEDVLDLLSAILSLMVGEVHRYEGMVNSFQGDGLLALFGAPLAHEDDPERAVRAALGIRDAVKRFAEELERERGLTIQVRIGLNTGLVVVGDVGSDWRVEYTAIGDAVNLAARMESTAAPGTVLISENTHRFVRSIFDFQPLGPIQVKGKRMPVEVYEVLGEKAVRGATRGVEGISSELVGRDREFETLLTCLGRVQQGQGQIVSVIGEAGLGKSRLVTEAHQRIGGGALDPGQGQNLAWIEGRAYSYGQAMSYALFRQIIRASAGIEPGEAEERAREKLRQKVEALLPPGREGTVLPFLQSLLGWPQSEPWAQRLADLPGEDLQRGVLLAVRRYLTGVARRQPLVLVFEDIHWADTLSLDLIQFMMPAVEEAPLLLLCVYRPEMGTGCWQVKERAAAEYPHVSHEIVLSALSEEDSGRLVSNLLEVDLPDPLRKQILGKAEGNPFYVEEVIRSLIEEGVLAWGDETSRWHMTRGTGPIDPRRESIGITVPDTLQGVIMARIDRLEEGARDVLQEAAVIGRIFDYSVLRHITESDGALDQRLERLRRAELIRLRRALPEPQYIFKHVLTQEMAYESLLFKRRRELHGYVGQAIETLYAGRLDDQLALLAYHYARSDDREKGIDYMVRAGERAASLYANADAISFYSQALGLLDSSRQRAAVDEGWQRQRFEILAARERAYDAMGWREEQRSDVQEMTALAQELEHQGWLADCFTRQSWLAVSTGDYPQAKEAAEQALALKREIGDQAGQRDALRHIGIVHSVIGEYEKALSRYREALAIDRNIGDRRGEGEDLGNIGLMLYTLGRYSESTGRLLEALQLDRESGNRLAEGRELANLGLVYTELGDYPRALEYTEKGLDIRRETGARMGEAYSSGSLGVIHFTLGNYEEALERYQEALAIFREIGDRRGETISLQYVGILHFHLGRLAEALDFQKRALSLAEDIGSRYLVVEVMNQLSRVRLHLDAEAALKGAQEATALARETGFAADEIIGLSNQGLAHQALGDIEAAVRCSQEAVVLLETHGLTEGGEEQVYFDHYRILRAAGHYDEAYGYLRRAAEQVRHKAARIADEEVRRGFLEKVSLNREILAELSQAP